MLLGMDGCSRVKVAVMMRMGVDAPDTIRRSAAPNAEKPF
jgi:hypothetical protein